MYTPSVASRELAKELYGLSRWTTGDWLSKSEHDPDQPGNPIAIRMNVMYAPAYDLGYLLRKLPLRDGGARYPLVFLDDDHWSAGYFYIDDYGINTICDADTPEDAACKLAIELFKQGILKRETAA